MDPQRSETNRVESPFVEPSREPLSATRFEPPLLQLPLSPRGRAAVLRDASSELEAAFAEAREEGRAAGYWDGYSSGRADLDAAIARHNEAATHLDDAVRALAEAVAQLAAHDRAVLEQLEGLGLRLAVDLAEALIGRELRHADSPLLDAVRRAAALLPHRGELIVRVHPADADGLESATGIDEGRLAEELGAHHRVQFVADASIESGACVVHVGALRIDTQLGPALARIRAELGVADHALDLLASRPDPGPSRS